MSERPSNFNVPNALCCVFVADIMKGDTRVKRTITAYTNAIMKMNTKNQRHAVSRKPSID